MKSRAATKRKMTEYVETDIGVKLSEFNDQLKKLRQCVTKTHPVSFDLFHQPKQPMSIVL